MYKDYSTISKHVTDTNAIKNSIRNILLTRRGSLPGKPRFGSDIYRLIFSPLDSLIEIMAKNFITESISEFEPRVIINEIKIQRVEEYNRLVVNIIYQYRDKDLTGDELTDSVAVAFNV